MTSDYKVTTKVKRTGFNDTTFNVYDATYSGNIHQRTEVNLQYIHQ